MLVRLWRIAIAFVLFTSVGATAAGASGGTPPPPLQPGPCATVVPQNPDPMTKQLLTLNLKATITSCSLLTQSNLVVAFVGGALNTTDAGVFTCNAPESLVSTQPLSYTLSPGASMGVGCSLKTEVNNTGGDAYAASGTGTATLYANCQTSATGLRLQSASDQNSTCTTVLAGGTYAWSVNVPIPPPGPGVRPN